MDRNTSLCSILISISEKRGRLGLPSSEQATRDENVSETCINFWSQSNV